MGYSYPQVEGAKPQSVKELMLKRWESRVQEKTSDLQQADQRLQQQPQSTLTQPKKSATAILQPYAHDVFDKKPLSATIEWNEFPPVQQVMPITQI